MTRELMQLLEGGRTFIEVQIRAHFEDVKFGNASLFSAIIHHERENHYFVFYSARINKISIMSYNEFIAECVVNKSGKNTGTRGIRLNGKNTKT
jgi:hypothetical protein